MQPAQLSLLPDLVPAPPPVVLSQLPPAEVARAVLILAGLIARTARVPVTPASEEERNA